MNEEQELINKVLTTPYEKPYEKVLKKLNDIKIFFFLWKVSSNQAKLTKG